MILLVLEAESATVAEVRCPRCNKLLFRGTLIGEILCARCGMLAQFPRPMS